MILRDKLGDIHILDNGIELASLIENVMGEEVGKAVLNFVDKSDYNNVKVNTDLESYEKQLDGYGTCILDVINLSKNAIDEIVDMKRMDRCRILEMLTEIMKECHNYI